jgi:hypothetical protein
VRSLAKLYREEDERVESALQIKARASPGELGADERIVSPHPPLNIAAGAVLHSVF